MIPRGHTHQLRPVSSRDIGNGLVVVHSMCVSPADPADPLRPACTLEQQLTLRGDDVVGIRFRFQGLWLHAIDLLRLPAGLAIQECVECEGDPAFEACRGCGGLGVVTLDGEQLTPQPLKTTR